MDRRRSPNYVQHNTSIPRNLSRLIRLICADENKTLGEATEEALTLWINLQKEKIENLAKTKTEFSKVSKTEGKIYQKENSYIKKEEVCA